ARRDDLVHAVLGQRGDETVEVAPILGLRVRDPETPDLRVELRCDVPRETLADRRRSFGHRMTVPRTRPPSLVSYCGRDCRLQWRRRDRDDAPDLLLDGVEQVASLPPAPAWIREARGPPVHARRGFRVRP